ncbi:Uncharacterised protein [uncultured archaeon]|nr:Uncharacterised protein [uncultured archaeon]
MCMLRRIASVFLVIGGLNWALTSFGWNVVDMIFGAGSIIGNIIYWIVGLSALIEISHWIGLCKCDCCKAPMSPSMPMKK